MKLLNNAKENFLQTSIAVLAIGAGVFMPTVETLKGNTELLMFFSIFGAFGGALLSKALEGTSAIEERVSKRFSERLNPINRHLASLAKEMTAIIRGAESNQTTPHEAMKLIEQLTPNLIGAMTDIGDLVGERFDPNTIYQTAHQVEELDKLLGSLSRYSRGPKEKALIIAAKDTLAAIHPDVYKRVSEPVKCPHCGTENQILIGEQPPASASPICSTCKQSFHAHRGKDLKVFAVAPGHKAQSTSGVGKVTIKCGCGEKFDAQPNVLRAIRKACLNCGQGFFVEADGSVRKLPDKQIVEYNYDEQNVNEKSVYCVEHHAWSPIRYRALGVLSGYCSAGSHVVKYLRVPTQDERSPSR